MLVWSKDRQSFKRQSRMFWFSLIFFIASVAADYDYTEVIEKSLLFYEAQRAGPLPDSNRISWRGDSCLTDGDDVGHDLQIGWFDAGDHVKFGFPMASSVTLLAWGMWQFEDGYRAANQWEVALDSIRWPLDYFIKAHVSDNEFYGQVGDGHVDHAYWGRAEEMDMERPAWSITEEGPGSDLAGETAAAMAASSIIFSESDPEYAELLLEHARTLYNFAYDFRGVYSDTITNAREFYNSFSGYPDELVWSAAWMYAATGEEFYLDRAYENYIQYPGDRLSWDDKWGGAHLLLYQLTGNTEHVDPITQFLQKWFPGGQVTYTPKGLAWLEQWGPNRYSANMCLYALVAAEHGLNITASRQFAQDQIHYMLGDAGRSYVCGYGENPPHSPHHRGASCPDLPATCDWDDFDSPDPNPQVLTGALVGGPDQDDFFEDDRSDYIMNEVATDYNAGFQGALAGLQSLKMRGLL